ncbi:hypothetical protein EVAR_16219_1 [Eumeta japonica]|uniref:Uncharacterized protein n=1 Tax=Eumeta variegata TaxID=151549 RepID=A0A4C1U5P2_EUMVA|nr:hypothetical protein EVAR_16219_1 [Eumeta japonica]
MTTADDCNSLRPAPSQRRRLEHGIAIVNYLHDEMSTAAGWALGKLGGGGVGGHSAGHCGHKWIRYSLLNASLCEFVVTKRTHLWALLGNRIWVGSRHFGRCVRPRIYGRHGECPTSIMRLLNDIINCKFL